MGHEQDWIERLRGWFIPKVGLATQLIEDVTGRYYYVKSETHNNQFVGRVPMCEEDFEKELTDMGFVRNPLSSWKSLGSTGESEEGSWRKTGFDDAPAFQLHVILYDGEPINNAAVDVTYVYAHWELAWDVHPIKHYRGVDANGPEGVRRMKRLLDEHGVDYKPIRP